jgi:hypothetical protein
MRPLLVTALVVASSTAAFSASGREVESVPGLLPDPGAPGSAAAAQPGANARPYSFYFTRAAYSSSFRGRGGRGGGGSWATDFPKADQQFLTVLRRLAGIDAFPAEHPIQLQDPDLRRYPFIYAVEVGYMSLTEPEVAALRDYLLAGGFMMVDDFWGSREWASFEQEMRRVLPEYSIVDMPRDHPIFSSFYDIREVIQVPNVGIGRQYHRSGGGPTHEQDGYTPAVRGIFDERGRLLVAINWNTDLGDAWEWAEQPDYPLKFSTYAYQMGVNFIVYAMTH